MTRLNVAVGKTQLKNPIIAGSAEHLIDALGFLDALCAVGRGAVVVKSVNELRSAPATSCCAPNTCCSTATGEKFPGTPEVPSTAFMATRSGLTPQSFEVWLDQTAQLDREAKVMDLYAIASVIVADLTMPPRWRGRSSRPASACSNSISGSLMPARRGAPCPRSSNPSGSPPSYPPCGKRSGSRSG